MFVATQTLTFSIVLIINAKRPQRISAERHGRQCRKQRFASMTNMKPPPVFYFISNANPLTFAVFKYLCHE